jgi:GTPase SAR1 family protein
MRLTDAVGMSGFVRIRTHDPEYEYSRESYEAGELIHADHNSILAPGITYILNMLKADPVTDARQYGITQMSIFDTGGTQRYKADLTDQYLSGADTLVNVLYMTSLQPVGQPYNINYALLSMDAGGLTFLANAGFGAFQKNNTLAVTFEWSIKITGV